MAERELTRDREAEAKTSGHYENTLVTWAKLREKALNDRVVVKDKDVPWERCRQAVVKFFLYPSVTDTVTSDWMVFVQDIRTHSGRHRHQGGLAIYVLEGKGWTTVDGVRHDWEEGDLVLLPMQPRGVVHQHFNAEQGKSCKWLAMIFSPFMGCTGYELEQIEQHPDWKES